MCLRRKFKTCRQPLSSTALVAEVRAKFGRPVVSGRKRKQPEDALPSKTMELCKKTPNKVINIRPWVLPVHNVATVAC